MFSDLIQNSSLGTFVPASLLLFLAVFAFKKSKPTKQLPNDNAKDHNILLAYKPVPMIDYSKLDNDSNGVVELPTPDEADPVCLNLAKVNYLGLLDKVELRKEAEKCIRKYGVGSCGPRGFYGTIDIHLTLESRLAEFMGMQESVLYSYGFSTISSAIGAYCKKSDIIFADEKISFSSNQGILAAKSTVVYFKHNDVQDLETRLKEYEKKEKHRKQLFRKFLVVEGIYGTTGTICPLPRLMELREKYKLRMFIDESHSFGVLGKTGRGVTEHFGVDRNDVDMIMSSLEGAVGSVGGFCVGTSFVIEHQRLSGLGYCFSASLPPFLSHIAICALNMFETDPEQFEKLKAVSTFVHENLLKLENYRVLSDPLSPLKVVAVENVENRTEALKNIRAFCAERKIYMIFCEEYLQFNVSVLLDDLAVERITSTLKEAF